MDRIELPMSFDGEFHVIGSFAGRDVDVRCARRVLLVDPAIVARAAELRPADTETARATRIGASFAETLLAVLRSLDRIAAVTVNLTDEMVTAGPRRSRSGHAG